jgi:hypothetical protein
MIRLSATATEDVARPAARFASMRDPMKYDADRTYHRGDRIRWAGKTLVHDGRQFVEPTE